MLILFNNLINNFKRARLLFPQKDRIAIICVTITIFICLTFLPQLSNWAETKALDLKTILGSYLINPNYEDDIIILAIDEKTLKNSQQVWPWPKDYWAKIINATNQKLSPKATLIDIFFQVKDKNSPELTTLSNEIKNTKNTGLVAIFEENFTKFGKQLKFFPPTKKLKKSSAFWGNSQQPIDPDGFIRTFLLSDFRMDKKHISYEICKFLNLRLPPLQTIESLKKAKCLIRFQSPRHRFKKISLNDLLNGKLDLANIKNKIVVIGATAPSLKDFHKTPIGIISGPELLCHTISTLKSGNIQFIEYSKTSRFIHKIIAILLSLFIFSSLIKDSQQNKALLIAFIVMPLLLISYSLFPAFHPPIALTYLVFIFSSAVILAMMRFIKVNRVQQSLHEAEICGKVQAKYLPKKDFNLEAGLEITGKCIPYQNAGGDYYDYFKIDENRVFFLLGDVSGHGVSASMLTTAAKAVVSMHSALEDFKVENILSDLNSVIIKLTKRRMMMSAVAGIIDYSSNKVTIYSSGHLPGILKTPGKIDELAIPGLPLGVSKKKMKLSSKEFEIPKNGKLFLYSDGIIEGLNWQNEMLGFDKFNEIIDNMSMEISGKAALEKLYLELEAHTKGRAFNDDVTILVLTFKPKEVTQ